MEQRIARWIVLVAGTIILVGLIIGQRPKTVQWQHTGAGVQQWRLCAPTCVTVTPQVSVTGATKTYRVRLPANAKRPIAIEACNQIGCGRAEATTK